MISRAGRNDNKESKQAERAKAPDSKLHAPPKMTRMRMGFSDKNWLGIGLNWVCFRFLKKSKSVKSSMFNGGFAFFELGSFSGFFVFKKGRLTTETQRHRGV